MVKTSYNQTIKISLSSLHARIIFPEYNSNTNSWEILLNINWANMETVSYVIMISIYLIDYPDSKVHGANMGPSWGRQDPGGSHVGHMNLVIWVL